MVGQPCLMQAQPCCVVTLLVWTMLMACCICSVEVLAQGHMQNKVSKKAVSDQPDDDSVDPVGVYVCTTPTCSCGDWTRYEWVGGVPAFPPLAPLLPLPTRWKLFVTTVRGHQSVAGKQAVMQQGRPSYQLWSSKTLSLVHVPLPSNHLLNFSSVTSLLPSPAVTD